MEEDEEGKEERAIKKRRKEDEKETREGREVKKKDNESQGGKDKGRRRGECAIKYERRKNNDKGHETGKREIKIRAMRA